VGGTGTGTGWIGTKGGEGIGIEITGNVGCGVSAGNDGKDGKPTGTEGDGVGSGGMICIPPGTLGTVGIIGAGVTTAGTPGTPGVATGTDGAGVGKGGITRPGGSTHGVGAGVVGTGVTTTGLVGAGVTTTGSVGDGVTLVVVIGALVVSGAEVVTTGGDVVSGATTTGQGSKAHPLAKTRDT